MTDSATRDLPASPPAVPDTIGQALQSCGDWMEMLPIAVYACDAEGRIVRFNDKAAALWGRTPAIGESHRSLCTTLKLSCPDGRRLPAASTPMALVLQNGRPVREQEVWIERPDGTTVALLVSIEPLFDDDGELAGAINCFQDITRRRRAEADLAEREQWYLQLLEALPAAIYTTDVSGRITYYNDAAVTLAGREPELGTDDWCVTWRLFTPEGKRLPHDRCPMAIALKEKRPVSGIEAVAERPDGTRVPFIPYPTPLRNSSGEVIGAVNMLVDISDRKSSETRQKMLLNELNHRVKNNLQMLHSLLRRTCQETPSEEARRALSDAAQRIGAIAAAHGVLYGADSPSTFRSADFVTAISDGFRATSGSTVTIRCEVDQAALPNDTAMPLALICNELLTNAATHGSGGRADPVIRLGLVKQDSSYVLYVEDQGPGFEFHDTGKWSSGLGLVTGLTGHLGGVFEVQRTRTGTTRCMMRFGV